MTHMEWWLIIQYAMDGAEVSMTMKGLASVQDCFDLLAKYPEFMGAGISGFQCGPAPSFTEILPEPPK